MSRYGRTPCVYCKVFRRSRTVAAAWNGVIENSHLIYGVPQHPEYRRYPVDGFLVVTTEAGD